MIIGKGKRKDSIVEISQQITNSVRIDIDDAFSQKMIDGVPVDSNSYKEIVKMTSEFLAAGSLKKLNDSTFYVCRSDAAMPYLNDLRLLTGKFKNLMLKINEASCQSINEGYFKIKSLEVILKDLEQIDKALQKEYEGAYAEAKEDCERRIRCKLRGEDCRGVYLEVSGNSHGKEVIEKDLKGLLSKNNCHIEQNPNSISFTFKVNAEDCNQSGDGSNDVCSSCTEIEVIDGKNKKNVYSGRVQTKPAKGRGKRVVCEKAAEAAASEIWGKAKDKINEACE
jgi:hypothetical protein